jgi:hypothetical protein
MTEPDAESVTPRPREKRVRVLLDRALSASAGLVALCALAVSMYQAWIAREQQRMSAWPYLTQDNTNADGGYARRVHNVGLGPALVRSMRVDVDGKLVTNWGDLLLRGLRVDSATLRARSSGVGFVTSSVRPGMVLLPGTTTEVVRIGDPAFADEVRRLLNDDRRVRIRVCYCSLYRDCWLSDSGALEPAEVRACPTPDEALEFQS